MAVISIATLKTFFETGDKPTEAQFVDLIDTLSALPTPGTTLTADQLAAINGANGPDGTNVFATMADIVTGGNTNITSIIVTALQALQTGSTISTTTFYNVTNAVGSTRVLQVYAIANNTNVVWAVDVTTGEIGTYNITDDVFASTSGLIETITKVNFDAKIAASELVVGKQYLVIAAYTSPIFGVDLDVLCIANSVNTVMYNANVVNFTGAPIPCEYDPSAPSVRIGGLISTATITPTIADTWSTVNAANDIYCGATLTVNAISATDLIQIQVSSDPTVLLLNNALSLTTGLYGTYDPATDTFTPYGGTYTPTLTPDGAVCTAAALAADAIYSVSNGVMKLMIPIDCTFDFTSNGATIDYTLPFGSIASSGGNVTFNLNPNSPSLPISGYEKNGVIVVTTKDTAFNDDLTIYATITIKLA